MKEGMPNLKTEAQQRIEQAEKVSKFVDKTDVYDYAKNFLDGNTEKPSLEEFKNFLIRVNGIARNIPISKRALDGKNVQLSDAYFNAQVPKHEDKEILLEYAYNSLDKVNKEDLKYLIPGLINAIHFFADGNGRTSRTLYQLLSGYASKGDFQENLKTSLGEAGRTKSVDVDPSLIYDDIREDILKKNGWDLSEGRCHLGNMCKTANVEFDQVGTECESYQNLKKFHSISFGFFEERYALTALAAVMGDKIDSLLTDKYRRKGFVSFHKMAEIISNAEWEMIFEKYYDLKKDQIKTFVDIFAMPEQFKSDDSPEENLKDKFIKGVEQRYQDNKEF